MEVAETGTATTSGLAKTLRHFGLDTRTPGLQREDRRAELQKRKIDQVKDPSSSDEDDQDCEEDNNGGGDDDDDDDDADILNEQSYSHFDDAGDVRGLVEGLSIAEDNQDANSILESKTRDRADNADAAHDEAWIEEFARGLVQMARQSGAATRSPKSKSTSAHAVLVSPKNKREGLTEADWNDKQAIHDNTDVDALRREIEELDRKRAARIRSRLHDSKDVEIQEAEWDLQRVQQELRRVERHRGIFIDSRLASQSGHMQRWAKEDLLPKLEALEREANARLEQEISRIRAEEESHPQYGRQAQNERRFKLHQMQSRHGNATLDDDASMSVRRGGGPNGSRQRADADEIGREALALHMGKRDLARAETLYRRALALDGRHATNLGNLALFIQQFGTSQHGRRDEENKSIEDSGHRNRAHDDGDESYRKACDAQADKFYRQAISADPSHSTNLANYASFLHKNLRQYERAEQYYERAVHEAPANASILGNFAVFLFRVRRDLVRADRMFQRALEIDPEHVNNCCNYASLLKKGFGKHREAQALYEDALKIDPENPSVLCNYANMLVKGADSSDTSPEACAQIQKARDLYLLALRVNPSHRMAKRNYMIFLRDFPTVRNMANERKLSEARPPPGPRPPQVHAGRVVSPPTSPTSPTSPKLRRRSKRSRSPHAAARKPMSPTLETLIE
ncbi:UDP-N-acetylglucosamine--peptide N-acetylglucosaminyltransferase 110 kDa subunit [Hondaea fermentalgiana]|uniref:UDP-N-acetylglucosamine--peptide N-acetylglucosaminyltransferase 110 kDa subunit n=1 Tax=Hondaea fermentalgiana TaxID=2315210 RepID=A0A2R5GD13_9STRA|nr:UDP-N-acetylglucosamine--peptide N-acetylglucosaminyltransferase 110 kDa subunit [Hondaea fermentalgiana]|eukprot:GBG28872.1 UDP-N-acetylglucosamine--peptide N-acetylglucosaminyltransferase 110 kDa subunit [Hondaea fermentalgiana]